MARHSGRAQFERDTAYPADVAWAIKGHPGIAFRILGWETVEDEDTYWSGERARTGNLLAVMIGDDHRWRIDPSDIDPIDRADYCAECGQLGCTHDAYDRDGN